MSKQPLSIFLKNITEMLYMKRTKNELELIISTLLTDQEGKPSLTKDEAIGSLREGIEQSLGDTLTEQFFIQQGLMSRLDPEKGDLINDIPEIHNYGKYCLLYFGDLMEKTYDETIEKLSHGKPKYV
jgi:hypothetical protein